MSTISASIDAYNRDEFATLTGDYNPKHNDPVASRRTQAGAPIVHGMHSLLTLLEFFVERTNTVTRPTALSAQYKRPIYVGESYVLEITAVTARSIRSRILVDGLEAVVASIGLSDRPSARHSHTFDRDSQPIPVPLTAIQRATNDLMGCSGHFAIPSTPGRVSTLFPRASQYFGSQRVAALAGLSCLVGMIVPGLHSLFLRVDVDFSEDSMTITDHLYFKVQSVDPRFHLVRTAVCANGMQGWVETMNCRPPTRQPNLARLRQFVKKGEFKTCNALIVGDSRGLGGLAAKLISAGGGSVIITYAKGIADATALAQQINESGGNCKIAAYDVRKSAAEQLASLPAALPSHIYYFATPPIFRRKAGLFDASRLHDFNAFYITGFYQLIQASLTRRINGITVFYPSSVALESREPDMTEYAVSKAGGELLCNNIGRQWQ